MPSNRVLLPLAAVVSLSGLGLFALPSLATSVAPAWWLAAAILITLGVMFLLPTCGQALTAALDRWAEREAANTLLLSRLTVFSIEVVLAQAILRRPVALTLGTEAGPVEATVAAGALSLLLLLLVWTYQTAKPVLRAWIFESIDAAIPTVGTTTIKVTTVTTTTPAVTVKAPTATITAGTTR